MAVASPSNRWPGQALFNTRMAEGILVTHVQEGHYRKELITSAVGHLVLLLFFLSGLSLFPQEELIILGSGTGGGRGGDSIPVGLAQELSGGGGMYKPALTPSPEAAVPQPAPQTKVSETTAPEKVFVRKSKKPKKATSRVTRSKPPKKASKPGVIQRRSDPGSGGPGARASGSGGGMGGGQGVSIGSGTGQKGFDSWYVRQVEQRIGRNWLSTSLGAMARPIRTIMSFEIGSGGQIGNIQIEESSGLRAVDLAAQRAIRASHPLPPLPYELRHRRVRFVAYFDYPIR